MAWLHHKTPCGAVRAPRVVGHGQQGGVIPELALHGEAHGGAWLPRGRDDGRGHLHALAARVAAKDVPRQVIEALACCARRTFAELLPLSKPRMCIEVHMQPVMSDISLPALPRLTSMLQPQRRSIFQNTIAAGPFPTCTHKVLQYTA